MNRFKGLLAAFLMPTAFAPWSYASDHLDRVRYGTEQVDGLDIFYREAGDPSKQAVVLLHGFPTSSHMYRKVRGMIIISSHRITPALVIARFQASPNMPIA